MERNYKTGALMAACIITVFILCFIQYYLVKNTYRLTRDNYYTEVRRSVSELTSEPKILAMQDSMRENVKRAAILYQSNQMDREAFLARLKSSNEAFSNQSNEYLLKAFSVNPGLHGVHYMSRYDELIIDRNGKPDTLLAAPNRPVIVMGSIFAMTGAILLNKNLSVTRTNNLLDKNGKRTSKPGVGVVIRQSDYIDITSKKTEIFRRMAGIFVMASGLIAAVIILFYLIFHALIRQKKIAQIKTDFANNVTHELKTPLTSVNLILKSILLKEVQAKPEMLTELLNSLGRQHGKIQELVDSVLESSMVADLPVCRQELNITQLLYQYARDLRIESHDLLTNIEDKPTSLFTNAAMVEKMLNILIDNAAKYSEADKPICLWAFSGSKHYTIEVTDQGSGIPKPYQEQIFEKFYRVPEQNRHTVKGLGLGLYLCRQVAQSIDAQLTVESKLNEGTTFIIKLPL